MQLRLLNSENGLIFGIDQAGRMPLMSIEPPQDYAPDLNWLLQSSQTPPEVILEVLVQEFYPQIYYLAFTLLDDRSAALNTANEIFARAILERHAYRTHTEASIWLLRLALKICETSYKRLSLQRAVKAALPHHRLSKDLGYSTPETLLDAEIWLTIDSLDDFARQITLLHYVHGWPAQGLAELLQRQTEDIQAALERTGEKVQTALTKADGLQSASNWDKLIRASLSRRWPRRNFTPEQLNERAARIGRRALRKRRWQRQAISVMEVAMILFIILFAAGIIWGANVFLPEQTPVPTRSILQSPATSTPADKSSSASQSTAQPPRRFSNHLLNDPYVDVQTGDTLELLAAELNVTPERLRAVNRCPAKMQLRPGMRALNPNWFPQVTSLPATPVSPLRLDQQLSVDFPQELLDTRLPWRGGYAQDASGAPEDVPPPIQVETARQRLPQIEPPKGFDPSNKRLTFQFPLTYNVEAQQALVELFADGYFLDWVVMGNPWQMICDRSSDGQWLAFVNLPSPDHDPETRLHWFDLNAPAQRHYTLSGQLGITQLAFSPDNQRLAYFVQAPQGGRGRAFILDIGSKQTSDLMLLAEAKSLTWSPDGRNLAMIARFSLREAVEHLLVLDVQTSAPVYSDTLENSAQIINNWLIGDWGVEFPQEARRMDDCAAPPTS